MSTIGKLLYDFRINNDITAKELIKKLYHGGKGVSASYITKVELHDEIPSPYFIMIVADLVGMPRVELLRICHREKVAAYKKDLEEKYRIAVERWGSNKRLSDDRVDIGKR